MKTKLAYVSSVARCAPLALAVLGIAAAIVVGCTDGEDDDYGMAEDGVSCRYGYSYGYGCNGYGR